MSEWQPIETAPKDGTRIFGYSPRDVDDLGQPFAVIYWYEIPPRTYYEPHPTVRDAFVLVERKSEYEGYWEGAEITPFRATHWMPLPAPPVLP